MPERTNTTDRQGIVNTFSTSSGLYPTAYGSSFKSLYKPFTTKIDASGIPRYKLPLFDFLYNSGDFGASSSGLNPYGPHTVFENIYSGPEYPSDLTTHIPTPEYVRTHGIKAPIQAVGWGYDIFGYPAPNSNTGWRDAAYHYAESPNERFIGGVGQKHGKDVPIWQWMAGPVDLRWDQLRGVWSANYGGVYAGRIMATYVSGDTFIEGSSYFAEALRYDVQRFDGIADQMTLTGVMHVGPKPLPETYKVRPLLENDFCFVVHYADENGTPRYGAWAIELPDVTECSGEEAYNGVYAGSGDPSASSGLLTGYGYYKGLLNFPLPYRYGGLGSNSGIYPSGSNVLNIFDATTINFTSGNTSLNLTSGYISFQNITFTVPTGLTTSSEVVLPSSGILTTRNDLNDRQPIIPGAVNTSFKYPVGVTGDMKTWSYNSGILQSANTVVSTGDLYHGMPGTNGSWPASNPAEPYFVWRKDDKELYHWDSSRGKWLGEKEFHLFSRAAAMTSGEAVRQSDGVTPAASTRGWGPPYDITVYGINARWVTINNSVSLSITQDGTIVETILASGTYHKDLDLDIDVSGDSVLGVDIGFSELSLSNPSIMLYFRRKGSI